MIAADPTCRVFLGGRILSMDAGIGEPEALVIDGGRIAAAGERGIAERYPHARVVDLGGRTLVPGFIDAHNHLSIAALHPLWADLSGAATIDALREALAAQAQREPQARWIRGVGWNEVTAGLLPDRRLLDSMNFDRPVIVAHYTLHQCVVNSHGLEELRIGRTTADPEGGNIVRDERGEPSGLLVERAWSEAHARSVAAYRDPDRWAALFAERARALLMDGITCIHDAACAPAAEALYRSMSAAGALPISVLVIPHAEGILAGIPAGRLDGPSTGEGDERVRVGPVKLFADGGIAPAMDVAMGGVRMQMGIAFPDLEASVVRVAERGFRVAVHAIGNAGVAAALSAFAAAERSRPGPDHRFRIEHACLASPAQLRQMAALGAVGVVQPGFVDHLGRAVESVRFDEEIWLPFGSMAEAGVRMAASSDDPCAFHEPLRTAAHGATRLTGSGNVLGPEEALSYEDWLRAYTTGAAYAGGQENERGSLAPGKRADLVILEGRLDPHCPPRVVQTWVEGTPVFTAGEQPSAGKASGRGAAP